MHPRYPKVFSPIQIGPIALKNRFYSSPHIAPWTTPRGAPTEDSAAFFAEKAKGGVGLVITSMSVPARARGALPTPHLEENLPAIAGFIDSIHAAGAHYFAEPWYHWSRPGGWGAMTPPAPIMSPSAVQFNAFDRRVATREMLRHEVPAMLEAFRISTEHLRDAGADGIMVHASHGTIVEQFTSPYFNRRTDEYGGSFENRMRFLTELLEMTRKVAGGRMAVGLRLNCDELLEGGYDTKESYRILKTLCDAGLIDFADLDVAVEPDQFHIGMPSVFIAPHVYRPYVEAVRDAAGKIPVLSVLGRLTSIADGEAALEAGVCDMVGAARALIAEPHLLRHAFEGTEERSRTCIACNWCMAAINEGSQSCTINPVSWRERSWGEILPAPERVKVIVVGGGPAGLEAARVSALRGHEVTLIEAGDRLGGALALWADLPGRDFYCRAIDWWERELVRLGVTVELGRRASAETILAAAPGAVIVATGARYIPGGQSNHRNLDIEGHDRDFVYRPEEILSGGAHPSGRIVMLDAEGMHTGVGLAERFAAEGSQVELLTPYFAPVSARIASALELPPLMKRLRAAGVRITANSYIRSIGDRRVTVQDVYSDEERVIDDVDAVVLSTGRVAVNDLEKELVGKVPQVFAVGDALAPRIWATASYEAHKFAREIGEPGGARTISDIYFAQE